MGVGVIEELEDIGVLEVVLPPASPVASAGKYGSGTSLVSEGFN